MVLRGLQEEVEDHRAEVDLSSRPSLLVYNPPLFGSRPELLRLIPFLPLGVVHIENHLSRLLIRPEPNAARLFMYRLHELGLPLQWLFCISDGK